MAPPTLALSERTLLEHRDFLRSLARSLVFDEHRAEDLVQQAWVTLLERAPRIERGQRSWLARVVRHLALKTLVREGERPSRERLAARPEAVEAREEQDLEEQELMLEAVRSLRQPYRSAIHLRYYRELTPSEIAGTLGIPVATVKTRLRRGLELLRSELDRRHGGSRRAWCGALLPLITTSPGPPGLALIAKGLILMNKTALAALAGILIAALAGTLWMVSRNAGPSDPLAGGPTGASPGVQLEDRPDVEAPGSNGPGQGAAVETERAAVVVAPSGDPSAAAVAASSITGRVIDDYGRPVPGAEVVSGSSAWTFSFPGIGDALDDPADPHTITDDQGHFTLALSSSGTRHLRVGADGFAPYRKEVQVSADRENDIGDLTLDPGALLSGVVVDALGRPVPGAEIHRQETSPSGGLIFIGAGGPRDLAATSDSRGRFEIKRLAVGPWKLSVRHPEHPTAAFEGETQHAGQRVAGLEFALQAGHEIAGHVVGIPAGVGELRVYASALRTSESLDPMLLDGLAFGGGSAQVQPDGSFRVKGLSNTNRYRLRVRASSRHGFGLESRSASVEAAPGDRNVQLVYAPPEAVALQVVDALTGEPLTEFTVEGGFDFLSPLTEGGHTKRNHPGGFVRFEGLRRFGVFGDDSAARLVVKAVGYRDGEIDDILLGPGEQVDLGILRLERAPVVTVEVRDALSGRPIEDAHVSLTPDSGGAQPGAMEFRVALDVEGEDSYVSSSMPEGRSGRTDAEGLCTLTSFPGQACRLDVKAEGYAPAERVAVQLPEKEDYRQSLRLDEGGSVLVRVIDPAGDPLAGMRVQTRTPAQAPGQGGPGTVVLEPGFGSRGGPDRISDSEGEVLFANLVEGLHRFRLEEAASSGGGMRITVPGLSPGGGDGWSEVQVLPGAVAQLTLVAPARGSLSGVITEKGLPLAGADVSLLPAEDNGFGFALGGPFGGGPSAKTDSKGRYAIEQVKADEYRLSVSHRSRAMDHVVPIELREGSNEKDLDLDLAIIEGRLTDVAGEPIAGALMSVERASAGQGGMAGMQGVAIMITDSGDGDAMVFSSAGAEAPETRTDEDGNYSLRGVSPETDLVVKARGSDFAPVRSEVLRLAVDEARTGVDLEAQPSGHLEVRMLGEGRLFIATWAGEAEGVEPEQGFADSEGRGTLSNLRAGPWSVRAIQGPMVLGGGAPAGVEVEVLAGETVQVELPGS